ncbi:MAG TPA: PASTA domain-containing protein, partial [Gaiellaceae bacterium]|nr:PASTA domain-containing protein [Gaiellaceae bacterium]
FVNGEAYRNFGPTEYEAKLGEVLENDTRTFHVVQLDAAGNTSGPSATLRAVPKFVGLGLEQARTALTARGFTVGAVRQQAASGVAAGTVIGPETLVFGIEGTAIDLVVAGTGGGAPQTRLALQVANAKQIRVQPKRTVVPTSVSVTRPSAVTATLYSPNRTKLFTWRRNVRAGRTVLRLPLPVQVRRPGVYRIVWVATSGTETIRRTVSFRLVGQQLQQLTPVKRPIEVVLTGGAVGKDALQPGLVGRARIVATATPNATFQLVASRNRNVAVVVVDVDRHGLHLVRDLRVVFPDLKVIALARTPGMRARALKAGAVRALPRSAPPATISKTIAGISSGR